MWTEGGILFKMRYEDLLAVSIIDTSAEKHIKYSLTIMIPLQGSEYSMTYQNRESFSVAMIYRLMQKMNYRHSQGLQHINANQHQL